MKTRWLFVVAVGLGCCPAAFAADWPQWRGPERNGVSKETGLLKEWPKDGPKLLWQVKDVGDGYSTPAVVGDRLYFLSNKGKDDEFVAGPRRQGRHEVWSTATRQGRAEHGAAIPRRPLHADRGRRPASTPSAPTATWPAGNGRGRRRLAQEPRERLRRHARQLGLRRVAADRRRRARLHAGRQEGHAGRRWTRRTATVFWKSAVPGGDQAAYASAIVVEVGGVQQYVQFLQKGVVGVDAKTGKFLWRYDKTAQEPGQHPDAGGRTTTSSTAPRARAAAAWSSSKPTRASPRPSRSISTRSCPTASAARSWSAITSTAPTASGLLCIEFATGEEKWQETARRRRLGAATPTAGCTCMSENGQVVLVEATPDGYHEKGRFTPPDPQAPPDRRKSARPGRTRWSPTAGSTSATSASCGATTCKTKKPPNRRRSGTGP